MSLVNNIKKRHQGSVMMMFLLALPVVITMMAVALDTGQAYVIKTELQNAVDACALAASSELDGGSAQLTRAKNAGVLTANLHKIGLQKTSVAMMASDVTFSDTLSGAYSSAPTTANYVKCSLNQSVNKLIRVAGLSNSDTVSAQAIAAQVPAQKPCALPIGVCGSALTNASPIGMWVGGVIGGGSGGGPARLATTVCNGSNGPNCSCDGGSCFRWVHFGSGNGSAAELQNLLTGNNTCNINLTGQLVSEQPGAAASPYDEYNTRFGVQKNSNNTVNVDFTGYAYTSPPAATAGGVYADYLTKRASLAKYQNASLGGGYTNIIQPTASNATSRRIGVAPKINCAGTSTTATEWVCVLMVNPITSAGGASNKNLYLEYLGPASKGACSQILFAGSGGSSSGPKVTALVQ